MIKTSSVFTLEEARQQLLAGLGPVMDWQWTGGRRGFTGVM